MKSLARSHLLATFVGLLAGAGWLIWHRALIGLFGNATDTAVTLFVLGVAGFCVGLRGHSRSEGSPLRTLGICWLALSVGTLVLSWLLPHGTLLGRVGVSIEVGTWITMLARLGLGALIVLPASLAAGLSLRAAARAHEQFGRVIPGGVLGAALGALAITAANLGGIPTDPMAGMVVGLGGLLIGLGCLLRGRGSGSAPAAAPADAGDSPGEPVPGSALAWVSAGVGLLLFALAQMSVRTLVPVFGNDLPATPVASFVFLLAVTVGLAVGIVAGRNVRAPRAIAIVQSLVALVGVSAILVLGNYDALPDRFAELVANSETFAGIVRGGLMLAALRVGLPALLLGAGAGVLLSAARSWAAPETAGFRMAAGALLGGTVGFVLAMVGIARWEIGGVLAGVSLLAIVAASVTVTRVSLRPLLKLGLVVVGPGIVAAAVLSPPHIVPEHLLVDRNRQSSTALFPITPKTWPDFRGTDRHHSAAILRRGHQKRLLINGRLEMARETSAKAHGVLTHLPLSVHPSPRRVLVIGAGTGWATQSAVAHPVERVECFEISRMRLRAARSFGPTVDAAFQDERVRTRIGDLRDLLSRSEPFDVILHQASGAWTERSAATCTVEFLSLVRDRLADGGMLAYWLPSEALTKTGVEILLSTFASVFAQVEVWDAGTGDLVLLAKKTPGRHDFGKLLASYRRPSVARAAADSWIETPETLLSQFLINDATVRRIAGDAPVHSRRNPTLGRAEARRRRTESPVDPVPGLAALRDDVVALFANTPAEGFRAAVQNVTRARDLERAALEFELSKQPYDAADAYEEALALNPRDRAVRRGFATLRSGMGIRYANVQNLTAAHAYMREAVETDTTYAAGFANLGRLLLQTQDFDYAISVLHQAIAAAPDDDLFLLQLGQTWKTRGYLDQALPLYEQAMELNPLNVEVAMGYIDTKLAMQGEGADLREGLEFLEKYREIEPDNEELLYRIGKFRDAVQRGLTAPEDE